METVQFVTAKTYSAPLASSALQIFSGGRAFLTVVTWAVLIAAPTTLQAWAEDAAKGRKLSKAEAAECFLYDVDDDGNEHCVQKIIRLTTQQAAECENDGGFVRYSFLGGQEFCQQFPRDNGKACGKSTDCEELCFADTRTCGPSIAVGLQILDENGNVVEGPVE